MLRVLVLTRVDPRSSIARSSWRLTTFSTSLLPAPDASIWGALSNRLLWNAGDCVSNCRLLPFAWLAKSCSGWFAGTVPVAGEDRRDDVHQSREIGDLDDVDMARRGFSGPAGASSQL